MSRASQVATDATLDIGSPSAKPSKYERMAFHGVLFHWNLRFCKQCHGTSRCKRCLGTHQLAGKKSPPTEGWRRQPPGWVVVTSEPTPGPDGPCPSTEGIWVPFAFSGYSGLPGGVEYPILRKLKGRRPAANAGLRCNTFRHGSGGTLLEVFVTWHRSTLKFQILQASTRQAGATASWCCSSSAF